MRPETRRSRALLIAIDLAVVGLGLPNGLVGLLWPAMRRDLGLPLAAGGVLPMVILCASAAACLAAPLALKRFRPMPLAVLGSAVAGGSLLLCRYAPSFAAVAALCVPLGAGQGLLDLTLNHYVAEKFDSRSVSWMQTCWCVGASLGVLLATRVQTLTGGWRSCYAALGLAQLALTMIFFIVITYTGQNRTPLPGLPVRPDFSVLRDRALAPCVLIVFLYSGAECGVSTWAGSFLVELRRLSDGASSACLAAFFAALMVGRFLTGVLVARHGDRRMIVLGVGISLAASVLLCIGTPPFLAPAGVALLGLGLAPVMPCMVHLTAEHFGPARAADVQGIQFCISYLGGSLLAAVMGAVYGHSSLTAFGPTVAALLVGIALLLGRLTRVPQSTETR
jgi:fucose permease